MPRNIIDSVQGTLDFLILQTLSWSEMHGYAIARWIRHLTAEVLQIEEGSLYPALHRLEDRGWIVAEWGTTEQNRRARFYTLTPAGRRQLDRETASWIEFVRAVHAVMSLEGQVA